MRAASQHILFLATEFDAPGMRPYARNIINTMWQQGDHVLIVTRHGADPESFPEIPTQAVTWIDYPAGKLARAAFRYWPTSVSRAIDRLIADGHITLLYALTGELVLAASIKRLQRRVPLLYTVHDAVYHDYRFSSPAQWLKDRLIIAWPQRHLFRHTRHKVTNSRAQLRLLQQRFPQDRSFYAPFPTLVNDAIERGGLHVEELKGVDDGYILFFGTLHLYKGVHLLYDTYLSHPELQGHHLVIAGSQDIYFERRPDEQGVTFINRYVDDRELRDLFSRAAVVVYPYISATQSGVTSIASRFGKPMVLSDLAFFKEMCDEGGSDGVVFFATGDGDDLARAIGRALADSSSSAPLYDKVYSPRAMRQALDEVFGSILAN